MPRVPRTSRRTPDLVAIIEAAYGITAGSERWLEGVLQALHPMLDRGLGFFAYKYDASDPNNFRMSPIIEHGIEDPRFKPLAMSWISRIDAAFVERTYRRIRCTTMIRSLTEPQFRSYFDQTAGPLGIRDLFIVNSLDPSGRGVYMAAFLPRPTTLSSQREQLWSRILLAADSDSTDEEIARTSRSVHRPSIGRSNASSKRASSIAR